MDSLRNYCLITDSFGTKNEIPQIKKYSSRELNFQNLLLGPQNPRSPRSIKRDILYNNDDNDPQIYLDEYYYIDDKIADPFSQLKSQFKERSSLILADIDTIFNFTDTSYLIPENKEDFNYVILDKPDIGFIQYMQYRLPGSVGFVNCSDDIPEEFLPMLNVNCLKEDFSKYITKLTLNLDLILCNRFTDINQYKKNLITTLQILKPNGIYIQKIEEKYLLKDLIPLLYLTSLNFKTLTLFKPFMENINSESLYIIAEEFIPNYFDILSFLKNSHIKVSHIKVPDDFINYIQEYFDDLVRLKEKLSKHNSNKKIYNMYNCLAYMNIF
jgi:hypothetical protein